MAKEESAPVQYPPFRRVVTGHTPAGDAVFESDDLLTPYDPLADNQPPATTSALGFTTVWCQNLTSFPVTADAPWSELNGQPVHLVNTEGMNVRVVDFAPGPGFMHRTLSVDFGIVLSGEVELELDHGVKMTLKPHSLVVQRGTIHAWNNLGQEPARMVFFLVPSHPLKYGDKQLEPTPLPQSLDGSTREE